MDFLKSLLEPGTIVGILGTAVGIWGLWASYKGRQVQVLEHRVSSTRIITNKTNNIPGLKIVVGDEFASDLISSKIEFFNHGNVTISKKDFASKAPLQVVTSGHFFNLDTINEESILSDNASLNPEISVPDNKTLTISFEYLKPRQSFSISVLHDGEISINGDLTAGKVRPLQEEVSEEGTFTKGLVDGIRKRFLVSPFVIAFLASMLVVIWTLGLESSVRIERDRLVRQIEDLTDQNKQLEDTIVDLQEVISDISYLLSTSPPPGQPDS